jgi:hypothetical protein
MGERVHAWSGVGSRLELLVFVLRNNSMCDVFLEQWC